MAGTYFQTAWTLYTTDGGTGLTGETARQVTVMSGSGTFEAILAWTDGGSSRFNATIITDGGTQALLTLTCGGSSTQAFSYTASATDLTFISSTEVSVQTKQ